MRVVPPGSTVGVLGSGQLGRMFALSARAMGYRVHTYSPDEDSPTGHVADVEVSAPYDDLDALRAFAKGLDVLTFEFENVPRAALDALESLVPVRPGADALFVSQNREREKEFLGRVNVPVAPWAVVRTSEDLASALSSVGAPAVLKTAAFGYDGKGQARVHSKNLPDAEAAWAALGRVPCVLESFVDFQREVSVIAARGADGSVAFFPIFENAHKQHILDVTTAPAPLTLSEETLAHEIVQAILEALGFVGVLCVEMFHAADGRLLVNEIAPRPHNSGHLTIDACVTSQFEQQLRAVAGLPLGSTELLRPAAMANLLGDLWAGGPPRWENACAAPGVALHLYGKKEPRPGRKMGHLTALAATPAEAWRTVLEARASLLR
ncbi:MAG TPA: 5-(carboxyamino)imidazole ribonucleotide synthase [Thermoanaerobaculia bacterium]|nr:5-(carboxyamino)imidazole ribonucleotide synthase [Thermoanaerobaculia bacterium]